jgi:hypothetical protein
VCWKFNTIIGIEKLRVIVTDGITIGHPCCGVAHCSQPLEHNKDHFCISKRPLHLAAFGHLWLPLVHLQIVTNSKQEVESHIFWTLGRTCWLLYKRNPFVQTRSTNFLVLLGFFWQIFLLVCIHSVLFFTCFTLFKGVREKKNRPRVFFIIIHPGGWTN